MADIELYRQAAEDELIPLIVQLEGDYTQMNLVEMNAFIYSKVKENERLNAIFDKIFDETRLLFVIQVMSLSRYFRTYDIYYPNKQLDVVNADRLMEVYEELKANADQLNAYLAGIAPVYPTEWSYGVHEFVTSHPANHFKNHTWGDAYDNDPSTAFNYPEASEGWEGIRLGFNETVDSDLEVDFFDKQETNLTGKGFQSGFWNGLDEIYTTPFPNRVLSNQSNRSARNSYVLSRVQVIFTHPDIGNYSDYLYHIEADFNLERGLDASFFSGAGINVDHVLNLMDEWDVINNYRENSYFGTHINVQRFYLTLTSLENQLRRDKIVIEGLY